MEETSYLVDMPQGGRIALHRIHQPQPIGLPLIVAHGSASNAQTTRTMGRFLAEQGYDCWLLEWGGHGQSRPARRRQDFEFPAFNDLPTAVETVLQHTSHQQVFWLAHSGGGHLPLMYLSRYPEKQSQFAGLATMGSQSTHAAPRLREKFAGCVLWTVTSVLGHTPRLILPLGNEPEPTRLLAQWATWNLRQRWHGRDGFDYLQALSQLKIPAVVMAAGRDQVAPPAGCRAIYEQLGSPDKTWVLCAEAHGFSKDLGHGELIRGSAAANEVFPRLVNWLSERHGIV